MDDLLSELNAALEASAGDEPQGTPEPAPEVAAQPEAVEAPAGDEPSSTPESEPAEPSLLQELRQKFDPALVDEVYRYTDAQLKSGLTPKLQRLSELEKQYEGIEAGDAEFLRQVYQLQQTDPRRAAEMLRQAAQWVEGPVPNQPPAPAAPAPEAAEPEFATDVERDLWLKTQALEQRLAQQDAWRQQQEQARNLAEIDAKFARLEGEVGRSIPLEERQAVARAAMQRAQRVLDQYGNVQTYVPPVDEVWKVLNFDKVRQAARNEAATVVERKAAISPAPATAPRPTPPPKEAETLEELLLPIYNARG